MKQQQNVIHLQKPFDRTRVAEVDDKLYEEMVGKKKANDGLHMSAEHLVITTD